MDTVIYSASPLKAFSGALVLLVFLFGLGGFGLLSAIFSRRQKTVFRVGQGCVSFFLLLAGVGSAVATFMTYQSGQTTAIVHVDRKRIVTRNCDTAGGTCTDYVIEATGGGKYYNFGLGQDIWEKIEEQDCYEFTYYPAKSLLGDYLQQDNPYADQYEAAGNIAQIKTANCP